MQTTFVPNNLVRPNWNGLFHLISIQNFGLNGKCPTFYRMHVERWTALPRGLIWVLSRTYCWTLQASHISKALRRFLFDFSAILLDSSAGRVKPSFLQTLCKIWQIWRREIYELKKSSKECHNKFPTNSSQLKGFNKVQTNQSKFKMFWWGVVQYERTEIFNNNYFNL